MKIYCHLIWNCFQHSCNVLSDGMCYSHCRNGLCNSSVKPHYEPHYNNGVCRSLGALSLSFFQSDNHWQKEFKWQKFSTFSFFIYILGKKHVCHHKKKLLQCNRGGWTQRLWHIYHLFKSNRLGNNGTSLPSGYN